ncbi:hypothetical protein [Bradyrhizobium viridifuturi]|uniref:hypothetical protein n=1 Tax=Bradyrhizobium viridifuturi TaxID=1654716 RepID=UPI00067E9235|nr:hypothetical protein [Bradyrhizobium viridifuturi]
MDQPRALRPKQPAEQMGISIAGQQHGLEEHHRHRPDRRRATEPRQHHLCEHRLNQEQQQRGHQQCRHTEEWQYARIIDGTRRRGQRLIWRVLDD